MSPTAAGVPDALAMTAVAACSCVILVPVTRRLAVRAGFIDVPDGRKDHSQPTPMLGGLAIYVAILSATLPAAVARHAGGALDVLAIAVVMVATGLYDDWRPLTPSLKLGAQVITTALLLVSGVRLHFFGRPVADSLFTGLFVLAVTNAVNLLDNMNGLATGFVAITCVAFGALSWIAEGSGLPLLVPGIVGACLGFLPYNFPRASIFMGDAGALTLGFLLSTVAVTALNALGTAFNPSSLVALTALFADMALVTLSRGRRRLNPLTTPGCDHISHRLARRFGDRSVATAICWGATACAGCASVLLALAVRRSR